VHDVLEYFATVYDRCGYHGSVRVWLSIDDEAEGSHPASARDIAFPDIFARGVLVHSGASLFRVRFPGAEGPIA
jgi:hypothetical protein